MSNELHIPSGLSRAERYAAFLPQVTALIDDQVDWLANTANIIASIKETFGFHWVGLYLVKDDELVLGPFHGPPACTRIAFGKGVCGKAWQLEETILVPDVEQFPGHIACSPLSKSEIVLPIFKSGKVIGVLDIDSEILFGLDDTDQKGLEPIITLIASCF